MTRQKHESLHSKLRESMLKLIKESSENQRIPPERELSERFEVSRSTMNKVLVELERDGYLQRKVGQGTFVAPSDKAIVSAAQSGRRTKGSLIMAYPDFFSHMIWELAHFAELEALKENVNLINFKLQRNTDCEALLNLASSTPGLLGLMIHMPSGELPDAFASRLDKLGAPVAILHAFEKASVYKNLYEVRTDHFKSGYLRAECLLRHGHRKISFAPNEPSLTINSLPVKGIRHALQEYGMKWKDVALPQTEVKSWDDPMLIGYLQAKELLKQGGISAIIFDTIPGAFGGFRAIYESGLKCPDDISVVTSMSHMGFERMTCPALSTVESSNADIVKTGFEIVLAPEKARGKSFIIDVALAERESVATKKDGE